MNIDTHRDEILQIGSENISKAIFIWSYMPIIFKVHYSLNTVGWIISCIQILGSVCTRF